MELKTQTIKMIHNISKEYESPIFSADELFQIGFIGYVKGKQKDLTGKALMKSIRNEIEQFLKAQTKNV